MRYQRGFLGRSCACRLSDNRCSSDLHAADGRYHDDCRKRFTNIKQFVSSNSKKDEDQAYTLLSDLFGSNGNRMWTSIDLEEEYINLDGKQLTREKIVERLLNDYQNDIMLLSSPGYANRLVFKSKANDMLRIQELDDEDDVHIRSVAKSIITDIKGTTFDKNVYQAKIDLISSQQDVSPTLSKLLTCISPSLTEHSLPAILLGNIITSIVAKRYTNLQIALAIMAQKKSTIEHLYDYRVTCSYDELVRFRTSAAAWTANRQTGDIIGHHTQGIVQVLADNFDCNISSMNGKKQTHSLATIVVQPDNNECEVIDRAAMEIPRLKKQELKDTDLPDVQHVPYLGPKKPIIPKKETLQNVPRLEVLATGCFSTLYCF